MKKRWSICIFKFR